MPPGDGSSISPGINGVSPLKYQSKRGPTSSLWSAMKPSTETTLCITTVLMCVSFVRCVWVRRGRSGVVSAVAVGGMPRHGGGRAPRMLSGGRGSGCGWVRRVDLPKDLQLDLRPLITVELFHSRGSWRVAETTCLG